MTRVLEQRNLSFVILFVFLQIQTCLLQTHHWKNQKRNAEATSGESQKSKQTPLILPQQHQHRRPKTETHHQQKSPNHSHNVKHDKTSKLDKRKDEGLDADEVNRLPEMNNSLDALEENYWNQGECSNCGEDLSVNKWTMPLLKSGDKRYYLGTFFKANWYRAAQFCRYHGMQLASVNNQEENDKLEKYVTDFGQGYEHFWTSGTDLAEEGSFFWMSTGRPIVFTNWNAGEPNNFKYENGEEEHCLELWNRDGKGLKWNDSPCSFETYFICEA